MVSLRNTVNPVLFTLEEELLQLNSSCRQAGIGFPVLLDGEKKLAGLFGVYAYPSTGVFGRDGSLQLFTASNWVNYRNAVEGRIRTLLGEPPAGSSQSRQAPPPSAVDAARKRAETSYHLAELLYAKGELAKAEQVLDKALADFEPHAPSHLLLSRIAHQRGNEGKSRLHLKRTGRSSGKARRRPTDLSLACGRKREHAACRGERIIESNDGLVRRG